MMKKVFKTLSAILLATACLTPGLAWADANPSVELNGDGALKVSNMVDVHSVLVEVTLSGSDVNKITDVTLENAPSNAMSSAVYDAANSKITVAVSSGKNVLDPNNGSLGTVTLAARGASASNPVEVNARVAGVEYIASEDSAAAVQSGSVIEDPDKPVTLKSTTEVVPPNSGNNGNGGNGNGNGDGSGSGSGSGGLGGALGSSIDSDNDGNGNGGNNSNATRTADYSANGVVSNTQAGQSTNTGLVKTGDVLMICGIGIGVAAIAVVVSMLISRKKASARK